MERQLLLSNGNTLFYKEVDGTCYNYKIVLKDGTVEEREPDDFAKLVDAFEEIREWHYSNRRHIRIWYGDTTTGRAWNEQYEVTGYVGRTCGDYKEPILLANKNSVGGPSLLFRSIVRVDDIGRHKTLYQHPKFHVDEMKVEPLKEQSANDKGYHYVVRLKDADFAFKTEKSAQNWIDFMQGRRYHK